MKKKILIAILILFSLFITIQIYKVIIVKKIYYSAEDFKNKQNRYYSVIEKNNNNKTTKQCYLSDKISKTTINNYSFGNYCEWTDYNSMVTYCYNSTSKIKYKKDYYSQLQNNLIDYPKIISLIIINGKINAFQLLKINYIIPTTYENKPCYKISANSGIVIIDKVTYLPVYSSVKTVNSSGEDNYTEYFYTFEVGTVTDEDVAIPDFSDYTIE